VRKTIRDEAGGAGRAHRAGEEAQRVPHGVSGCGVAMAMATISSFSSQVDLQDLF
jgi:hypothetical protein